MKIHIFTVVYKITKCNATEIKTVHKTIRLSIIELQVSITIHPPQLITVVE